jgi:Ribbon-helix-helix protein, copG family
VGRKVVRNYAIDQELVEALERESATRGASMSLIVREALRRHFREQKVGAN